MLKFKLDRKTVSLEMEIEGVPKSYTLKELTGLDRDKYMEFLNNKSTGKGMDRWVKDPVNIQAKLISMCLYDEMDKPVQITAIQKYPSSVVQALYMECEDISGLAVDEKELAKLKKK